MLVQFLLLFQGYLLFTFSKEAKNELISTRILLLYLHLEFNSHCPSPSPSLTSWRPYCRQKGRNSLSSIQDRDSVPYPLLLQALEHANRRLLTHSRSRHHSHLAFTVFHSSTTRTIICFLTFNSSFPKHSLLSLVLSQPKSPSRQDFQPFPLLKISLPHLYCFWHNWSHPAPWCSLQP